MSSGQKFMVSLLVNSLVSHGGLEQALTKAIELEAIKLDNHNKVCKAGDWTPLTLWKLRVTKVHR